MPQFETSTVVTQFRARRPGPEALMQDVVVHRIPELFCPSPNSWTAASVPLGAGVPDLVVVSYDPQVFALAHVDLTDAQILAYLRAVGKARLDTIAERMGTSPEKLSSRLFFQSPQQRVRNIPTPFGGVASVATILVSRTNHVVSVAAIKRIHKPV